MPRFADHTAALLLAAAVASPSLLEASPRVQTLKLRVTNPSGDAREAEPIVVSIVELKKIAPDFKPVPVVVTHTKAATIEEDATILQATEVPSQVDDVDGDGSPDEIAFQIDLGPNESRVVTIAYGDAPTIWRLRGEYSAPTHARFATKYEGPGWESERTAWRLYFDKRNAVDLFGKRRPGLHLDTFASAGYDYHAELPIGRDIYRNGDAIGIGSVAALVDGKVVKVAEVAERSHRIVSTGPVRAIVELTYRGWKVAGEQVTLVSRFTQWAGDRGFWHDVSLAPVTAQLRLVTGLPVKPGLTPVLTGAGTSADQHATVTIVSTWGPQVLRPGATATESLPDQQLGLAIAIPIQAPSNDGRRCRAID
jgi:hypothetical protein